MHASHFPTGKMGSVSGEAMAEVTVTVGTLEFVAAITEGSVKTKDLKVNNSVTVAI